MSTEPDKLYYSIREVSEMTDVKPHVLRYWEAQFSMLRPKKNRAGARMYRAKDIDYVREIKRLLYDRGFTIAGARRFILDRRHSPGERAEAERPVQESGANEGRVTGGPKEQIDCESRESPTRLGPVLRQIRRELADLKEMLEAPAGTYRRRRAREE